MRLSSSARRCRCTDHPTDTIQLLYPGTSHLDIVDVLGSVVGLLRPVLDTYLGSPVGLLGCRSTGLARDSCEYDLVVVRPEKPPPTTLRAGEVFLDVYFITEAEAMSPPSPEVSVSLAFSKPIQDPSLILSSCVSAARESFKQNTQRSVDGRLTAAVKNMGRSEEALSTERLADADLWLLVAGNEFSYAWLYSEGRLPAPSHLLSQLRDLSRGQSGRFEAFSRAVGLAAASRAACERRLDGLAVVYDIMGSGATRAGFPAPTSLKTQYELLELKSASINQASQPVDCYCFLGLELARDLPEALRSREGPRGKIGAGASLSGGENRLLADAVVQDLGIGRPANAIRDGLRVLRREVSALSRRP